jgi:cytochrome c-type biogenesis protein CcmH
MKPLLTLAAALLVAIAGITGARAQSEPPQEAATIGEDPVLEKRVNEIGLELRCLVCQNQTISDSHAGLANDLKNQIREQLKAGKSEKQILEFMVERYGDFVLYRPPMKATTAVLWVGPFALLAAGIAGGVLIVRRRRDTVADPSQLTDAQRLKAAQLLADEPETRT